MRVVIGSDHGGFALKEELKVRIQEYGDTVTDIGCHDTSSVDYPDIAKELCRRLLEEGYDYGILLCGTGIGISIAANKIKGIRAAHIADSYSAAMAKAHNNANVLCMGGRTIGVEVAASCIEAYRSASFLGGRHQNRVDKIMALEREE